MPRSPMTTFAPLLRQRSAVALPIPDAPPVLSVWIGRARETDHTSDENHFLVDVPEDVFRNVDLRHVCLYKCRWNILFRVQLSIGLRGFMKPPTQSHGEAEADCWHF